MPDEGAAVEWSAGQSAVIVPVPAADPVVGPWRALYDRSAPLGVPAHVTIVVPFVPEPLLTDEVRTELAALTARTGPIDVRFGGFGEFPGVLYLEPDSDEPFRLLTRALVRRWPEYPPYGGQFGDDPVPHLTVGEVTDAAVLSAMRAELAPALPIGAALSVAWLMTFDGARWNLAAELPLG
jgi:2'-5' RNA ligase